VDFSLRQWLVIVVLIAGFAVAAVVVSRGGDSVDEHGVQAEPITEPRVDEVAWCALLAPLPRWGGILDGSAGGDDPDHVANLQPALEEVQAVAPTALAIDIARLLDLVLLTKQALDDSDSLGDALAVASAQTDQPRVRAAVATLDDALVACGHSPVG